uniref:Uncharacterized protein n=1 Tax=Arundo donax TaxID=35708 RepID=A0A0A9D291_ARUDO
MQARGVMRAAAGYGEILMRGTTMLPDEGCGAGSVRVIKASFAAVGSRHRNARSRSGTRASSAHRHHLPQIFDVAALPRIDPPLRQPIPHGAHGGGGHPHQVIHGGDNVIDLPLVTTVAAALTSSSTAASSPTRQWH